MSDRGYVPYALLGVLVLVASASLSASLQPAVVEEPSVDSEMERVGEETQTTLREASLAAANNAAAEPVVESADTPAGRVLREDAPFEDALRLRTYRQLQAGLEALGGTRDGITVTASLPSMETTEEFEAARDRVDVSRAGSDGTQLRVTVSEVRLRATRGDREVANRTVSPTVVVDTPVLVVHDRVDEFEAQLNAGVMDGGLGRALSARLYPVAWARGWAQYGGVPIQSVIANRHVSLATNDAVLSLQREQFGTSDPVGERAHRTATTDTLVTDLLAGVDRAELDFLERARAEGYLRRTPVDELERYEPQGEHPSPHDSRRLSLDEVADTELVDFIRGEDSVRFGESVLADLDVAQVSTRSHLEETFRNTYSENVRIAASVEEGDSEVVAQNGTRSHDWSQKRQETDKSASVSERTAERGPRLGADSRHAPEGWTRHAFYARTVTVTETVTNHWDTPAGSTETTSYTVETEYEVNVSVLGQQSNGPAPGWNVTSAYNSTASPVDGPNLSEIPPAAEALVADRGGPDALARAAVDGTLNTSTVQLYGEYPDTLEEWVFDDLNELRQELSGISYETTQGKVATFETNPPARLGEILDEKRELLLDAPDRYDSVAHRASVAAQVAYLDRVAMRLDLQAAEHHETRTSIDGQMDSPPDDQFDRLQQGLEWRSETTDGPGVDMRVDARPSYLTREPIDDEVVPALPANRTEHPLVVRNRNLLAVPYGAVSDAILDRIRGLFSTDRTSLHAAADVLEAVEVAAAENGAVGDLAADGSDEHTRTEPGMADTQMLAYVHGQLEESVADGTDAVVGDVVALLGEYDLGDESERTEAVESALSRWDGTAARALALTEGEGKAAIQQQVHARWGEELSATERQRLELELQWIIDEARADSSVRPATARVEDADDWAHQMFENATRTVVENATARLAEETYTESGRVFANFPKGAPVAPPPLPWLATVNFWHVEVAGEYPTFQVRAPHGSADRPGGNLVYVRDGSNVTVDLTGDGSPELLGSTPRVRFENSADIAVAVPSGPRGVGDVDGRRDEESPGWPEPGPDE